MRGSQRNFRQWYERASWSQCSLVGSQMHPPLFGSGRKKEFSTEQNWLIGRILSNCIVRACKTNIYNQHMARIVQDFQISSRFEEIFVHFKELLKKNLGCVIFHDNILVYGTTNSKTTKCCVRSKVNYTKKITIKEKKCKKHKPVSNDRIGLTTRTFCQFSGFLWTGDTNFCFKISINNPGLLIYLFAPDEQLA